MSNEPHIISGTLLYRLNDRIIHLRCGPRPRLGWVEMGVGLPEGPSYPGHCPSFFRNAAL